MKKLIEIINEKLQIKKRDIQKTGIYFIVDSIFNELFDQQFDEKIINVISNKNECNLLSINNKDYIFCISKYNDYEDINNIEDINENFYNSLKGAICVDIIYRKDEYKSHKYNITKGIENVKNFVVRDLVKFDFDNIEESTDISSEEASPVLWNSSYSDLNYELEISFDIHAERGMKSRDYDVPDDPDEFYLKNLHINNVNVSVNNNSSYDGFNINIPFDLNELKGLSKSLDSELNYMVDIDDFDINDYI